MKIFVFGAGASQGSQERLRLSSEDIGRAPLVDELFSPQYRFDPPFLSNEEFAECRQGTLDCGSVEQWLSERWKQIESLKEERTKVAEKAFFGKLTFYLWVLFQKVSHTYTDTNGYSIFLQRLKLRDEPFALISFNYDTLLDQAAQSQFGISLLTLDNYLSFPLIKPHGSVNWILPERPTDPKIPVGRRHIDVKLHLATERLFNGPALTLRDLVVYPARSSSGSTFEVLFSAGIEYSYPLLFMPLTAKLYSRLSDFYARVIGKGKELLTQATEVYLIGYRAADDITREMFQAVKPGTALHIVGHGSAADVMTSVLSWAERLSQGEIHNEGFMEFANTY